MRSWLGISVRRCTETRLDDVFQPIGNGVVRVEDRETTGPMRSTRMSP